MTFFLYKQDFLRLDLISLKHFLILIWLNCSVLISKYPNNFSYCKVHILGQWDKKCIQQPNQYSCSIISFIWPLNILPPGSWSTLITLLTLLIGLLKGLGSNLWGWESLNNQENLTWWKICTLRTKFWVLAYKIHFVTENNNGENLFINKTLNIFSRLKAPQTLKENLLSYCGMISTIYFHPVTRLVNLENRRILLAESWAGNSKW